MTTHHPTPIICLDPLATGGEDDTVPEFPEPLTPAQYLAQAADWIQGEVDRAVGRYALGEAMIVNAVALHDADGADGRSSVECAQRLRARIEAALAIMDEAAADLLPY